MSLPGGIVNQTQVETHPRVVGNVVRVAFWSLIVGSGLIALVIGQVHGVRSRYECTKLEQKIEEAREKRRYLLKTKIELLAPAHLREVAARLNLQPPPLSARPGAPLRTRTVATTAPEPIPVTLKPVNAPKPAPAANAGATAGKAPVAGATGGASDKPAAPAKSSSTHKAHTKRGKKP